MLLTMLPMTAEETTGNDTLEKEQKATEELPDVGAEPEPDVALAAASDEVTIVSAGTCGGEEDGSNLTWTALPIYNLRGVFSDEKNHGNHFVVCTDDFFLPCYSTRLG
jgi:hypothetical protein